MQYFPGTAHQSCLHLSAMLPTSESAEDFVSLLASQHSHPSVPELCSALLHFPSLFLSAVVLTVLYALCLLSQWGTWLLVLNVFPQHLMGFPEAHSATQRHVPALLPLDPSKPFSFLIQVSVSISLLPAVGREFESKTSFPTQHDGEALLLPHCHYFPPEVTQKLL